MCFIWISEQTATFALHIIEYFFTTNVEGVYCAVRNESLYKTITFRFKKGQTQLRLCRRFCKVAKSDYQLCHVCPPARPSNRMERHDAQWTDFCTILCWRLYWNSLRKLNVTSLALLTFAAVCTHSYLTHYASRTLSTSIFRLASSKTECY
jgi:hypothetical protein